MKRLKCILFAIIFVLTTGFTNYDISMNIEKNKEMEITINILTDSLDEIDNVISLLEDKNTGYDISRNDSNDKYGLKIYKHVDNIDNVSFGKREDEFKLLYLHDNEFTKETETKMFNVDKQFDTNRYAANFYVDISELNINLNNAAVTYTLTLPEKPESNNAQFVNEEGNVLTWNIGANKTDIDFVFKLKSYDTIYYIVAIVIAIFLVFSIISNLFSKGGDPKNDSEHKKTNSGPTDLDRRIQNFTQNSLNKNITNNSNNVVNNNVINNNLNNNNGNNVTSNSSINQNNNMINQSNLATGIPIIKPDFNNSSSDVKKQGIFDKLKKEDTSIGTLYDTNSIPTNEEFNKLINNVSNSSNTVNTDNTNNTINNVNMVNTENTVNNIDASNTNNNIDIKSDNVITNSDIIRTVPIIQNNKLDVNNVEHNLNNMFEYEEPTKEEIQEKVEPDDNSEIKTGPVIKFNNKEIVITKNDEEE